MSGLVGRETTVGALTAAMAAGIPVLVTGEAGIGKTAVLRAAAGQCGRRVFEGGGLATLGWHSYLPLTRALRRPVPAGDLSAVAEFVRCRVRDGLLVVDDAHWADPATLAVLPFLVGEIAVAVGVRAGDVGSGAALSALSSGWLSVGVGPLSSGDAARLVSGLAPSLDAATVGEIVTGSGGNPLYLEEQALRGRSAASLRLLVAERLRACSPDARQALAASALLGRPASRSLLGPSVAELAAAHLVEVDGETVTLRHGLVGEAAAAALAPADRRRLHGLLAGALVDPGEAARHFAAAGDTAAAFRLALQAVAAAALPAERAAHLSVAAACAPARQAAELRLAAAAAFLEADDPAGGLAAASHVISVDDSVQLRTSLIRARALGMLGRAGEARAAASAGLACVADVPTPGEAQLRIELARACVEDGRDRTVCVQLAASALALAVLLSVEEATARQVYGTALLRAGGADSRVECIAELRAALALASARSAGAPAAASALAGAYRTLGDLPAADEVAQSGRQEAAGRGWLGWELHFAVVQAELALLRGETSHAAELAGALLGRPLRVPDADTAAAVLVAALARLGRHDEANAVTGDGALVAIARAEAAWLCGQPQTALRLLAPLADTAVVWLTAWAGFETGRPVAADHPEVAALAALSAGNAAAAARDFDAAADSYAGCDAAAAVRCRWAAGDAAVQAGDADTAREWLSTAWAASTEYELVALQARISRSARPIGLRLAASPGTSGDGGLSAREREVLGLVGAGLSTADIAARLAVASSTVETQVRSAMRKLDARTRRQAAMLAADIGQGSR